LVPATTVRRPGYLIVPIIHVLVLDYLLALVLTNARLSMQKLTPYFNAEMCMKSIQLLSQYRRVSTAQSSYSIHHAEELFIPTTTLMKKLQLSGSKQGEYGKT